MEQQIATQGLLSILLKKRENLLSRGLRKGWIFIQPNFQLIIEHPVLRTYLTYLQAQINALQVRLPEDVQL